LLLEWRNHMILQDIPYHFVYLSSINFKKGLLRVLKSKMWVSQYRWFWRLNVRILLCRQDCKELKFTVKYLDCLTTKMNVLQSFESSKSIRQSAQCKIQICWLKVPRNVVTALHAVKVPRLKPFSEVRLSSMWQVYLESCSQFRILQNSLPTSLINLSYNPEFRMCTVLLPSGSMWEVYTCRWQMSTTC
jgi:hypothetical protein